MLSKRVRRSATIPTTSAVIGVLFLMVPGCLALVLPEGWEEAIQADSFRWEELGTVDSVEWAGFGTMQLFGNYDSIDVNYQDSFPCTEQLRAFVRVDGEQIDLLVQPVDLHPSAVAGSNCVMEMTVHAPDLEQGRYSIALYRRDNDVVDPDMAVRLVDEDRVYVSMEEES